MVNKICDTESLYKGDLYHMSSTHLSDEPEHPDLKQEHQPQCPCWDYERVLGHNHPDTRRIFGQRSDIVVYMQ